MIRCLSLILCLSGRLALPACSRAYVLAAAQGIQQGFDRPVTSCRTTYASRGTRAASYTTCHTY
jgi:hypothetical protein